jgi:hypothetical protein
VAIGVLRPSCASRILRLEQPPAVGGAERAAPRPRTEGPDEIRRIQAQANQCEDLSLIDQHGHVRDCWKACAALGDDDRIAAVCADLCI